MGLKSGVHSTGPAAQTSPELIFHIINMSQDSSVSVSVAERSLTALTKKIVEKTYNDNLESYILHQQMEIIQVHI